MSELELALAFIVFVTFTTIVILLCDRVGIATYKPDEPTYKWEVTKTTYKRKRR